MILAGSDRSTEAKDWRRPLLLGGAFACWTIGLIHLGWGATASSAFGAGVFVRAGVALFLLWLAYPSLRRPVRWLPPGVLLVGLGILALIVIRPQLVRILLPLLGALTAVTALMGWWRKLS